MTDQQVLFADVKESIKLMKMSKAYQWEVRVNIFDLKDLDAVSRLTAIDSKLRELYGSEEK